MPKGFYYTDTHTTLRFATVFLILELLPRLMGGILGKWGYYKKHNTNAPGGKWVFLGNILPETCVEIEEPYPTLPGKMVGGCKFYQTPTLGGLAMVPLHVFSQILWPIKIVTTGVQKYWYYLPIIKDPAKGWQSDVMVTHTNDPLVWNRTFISDSSHILYIWMHESHEWAPMEDYIFIKEDGLGWLFSLICMATVVSLIIWSHGFFILVMGCEFLLKRFQYILLRSKLEL